MPFISHCVQANHWPPVPRSAGSTIAFDLTAAFWHHVRHESAFSGRSQQACVRADGKSVAYRFIAAALMFVQNLPDGMIYCQVI